MKKAIFLFFLLFSVLLQGQNASPINTAQGAHFEFSFKVAGGVNIPFLNRLFTTGVSLSQKEGNFNSIAFQASLAGRKSFSLLMEAGYATSYNYFSYLREDHGVSHDMTDEGRYSMNIRKEEFALMAKHYLTRHHIFYVDYGLYLAAEDQKIINGTIKRYGYSYNPNYNPGPYPSSGYVNYQITDIYDNKHVFVANQMGLVQGLGWSAPFKNKGTVFIDVRLNIHNVLSHDKNISFKIVDLGLSVGYTFYKTKGHTKAQNLQSTGT